MQHSKHVSTACGSHKTCQVFYLQILSIRVEQGCESTVAAPSPCSCSSGVCAGGACMVMGPKRAVGCLLQYSWISWQ